MNILNIIIAVFVAGYIILQLSLKLIPSSKAKTSAYQWWYTPWLALLFSLLMAGIYAAVNPPRFITMIPDYQVQVLYCLAAYIIWLPLQYALRKEKVQTAFLNLYHKHFAKEKPDALPFPYFHVGDEVYVRVGQKFYRWTLKFFVLAVGLVYAFCFLMMFITKSSTMYLISSHALLGILPILEYYIYLCADVPVEKLLDSPPPPSTERKSDFDSLWKHYVDTFDNYSIAWKRTNPLKDQIQRLQQDQNEAFCQLLDSFQGRQKDCIIENCDLVDVFTRLEQFYTLVSAGGKYVLIALDVPKHLISQNKTFTNEIANKLSDILHTTVVGYHEGLTQDSMHNSIVVAPLSLLMRHEMNEEWMRKIGLVTVVNVSDKGVSDLYECRKFSFLLKSVNPDFRMIFITPNRRGMEPAMANTWLTGVNMDEQKMRQFSVADQLYFIGYNAENFRDRFNHILTSNHAVTLYSGSEMAPIAISSKFGSDNKSPTTVHYFELAYSNAIEGKQELKRHHNLLDPKLLDVTVETLEKHVVNHFMPLDQVSENQLFSVIFDQENNAPAAYLKWLHLGNVDNFSVVISKPYLFRDYFNANHDFFVSAPFVALQPHLCKSRVTLAIILFRMLQHSEVEEKDLREFLNRYYDENEITSIPSVVLGLFRKYFDIDLQHNLRMN